MSPDKDVLSTVGSTRRRRLPNRRSAVTESIQFAAGDGRVVQYEASVGFDELGRPKGDISRRRETRHRHGGRADGTDTAVMLSVALQHGITAQSMALSMARVSLADGSSRAGMPASVVGAALDLLSRHERAA